MNYDIIVWSNYDIIVKLWYRNRATFQMCPQAYIMMCPAYMTLLWYIQVQPGMCFKFCTSYVQVHTGIYRYVPVYTGTTSSTYWIPCFSNWSCTLASGTRRSLVTIQDSDVQHPTWSSCFADVSLPWWLEMIRVMPVMPGAGASAGSSPPGAQSPNPGPG
jgi:hypothetical protein